MKADKMLPTPLLGDAFDNDSAGCVIDLSPIWRRRKRAEAAMLARQERIAKLGCQTEPQLAGVNVAPAGRRHYGSEVSPNSVSSLGELTARYRRAPYQQRVHDAGHSTTKYLHSLDVCEKRRICTAALLLAKDPRAWTREDVALWLRAMSLVHGVEVHLDRFLMNGKGLCLMNIDMFVVRVPLGGKLLYRDFQLRLHKALHNV